MSPIVPLLQGHNLQKKKSKLVSINVRYKKCNNVKQYIVRLDMHCLCEPDMVFYTSPEKDSASAMSFRTWL